MFIPHPILQLLKRRRLMKLFITSTKMARLPMTIMWPHRLNLRVKYQLMQLLGKRPMGLGQLNKPLRR